MRVQPHRCFVEHLVSVPVAQHLLVKFATQVSRSARTVAFRACVPGRAVLKRLSLPDHLGQPNAEKGRSWCSVPVSYAKAVIPAPDCAFRKPSTTDPVKSDGCISDAAVQTPACSLFAELVTYTITVHALVPERGCALEKAFPTNCDHAFSCTILPADVTIAYALDREAPTASR